VVRQYSFPALVAAAATGQVDYTWGWDMRYLGTLRRSRAYRTQITPQFVTYFLVPNLDPTYQGKPNPLANRNVRLALSLAIDRVRLTEHVYGVSRAVARKLVSWNLWINMPQLGLVQPFTDRDITGQWDPIAGRYITDTGSGQALADAKKLLARTPWKNGFSLDFLTARPGPACPPCDVWPRLGGAAKDWLKLGVGVRTRAIDLQKLCCGWSNGTALTHGDFQLSSIGIAPSVDPDEWRFILDSQNIERDRTEHTAAGTLHTGPRFNFAAIRDPSIDRAVMAAEDPLHPRVRAQNYAVVQQRVNQRAYYFPVTYVASTATIGPRASGVVTGLQLGPAWAPGSMPTIYDWRVTGQ
jgi:ABC-type transport system substrate-binding protein